MAIVEVHDCVIRPVHTNRKIYKIVYHAIKFFRLKQTNKQKRTFYPIREGALSVRANEKIECVLQRVNEI